MAKKILIDAAHEEETRVVVVDGQKVEEFDFETRSRKQIVGSIYLARVARVEPALQSVFVEYGGDRHGFLPFSEIHPDYYQIPVADKERLEAEIALSVSSDTEAKDVENVTVPYPPNDPRDQVTEFAGRTESTENTEISGMQVYDTPKIDNTDPQISGFGEVVEGDKDSSKVSEKYQDISPAVNESQLEFQNQEDVDSAKASSIDTKAVEQVAADDDANPDDAETVARAIVQEQIKRRRSLQGKYKVQEVIRPRQILLVQATREARGTKGASFSTYISLAGRYCVLMPNTARGGGISRKISGANDRNKLKLIAKGISVPEGAGLIIRTAGVNRTKQEIKRDYDYLLRQWDQIRMLTFKSIAPTPIYEEGGLIKRTIRDIYTKAVDKIIVEGDEGYRIAKDFMKLIMPSHAKKVQQYSGSTPLFSRHQIEGYLTELFNPLVQLPSGGYLVIGITEALVAIDVNSGRATDQDTLAQTALQTNLEAAEEVTRQIRLRDLAGIIVIDFIDMPDKKHNAAVEKRLKENMKVDRARIHVGQITGFGLLEMSRQRLRPGIVESISAPCRKCNGTGWVRSDESLVLTVLRQLESTGMKRLPGIIRARLPIRIANMIANEKRSAIIRIEQAFETKVRIEADAEVTGTSFLIEVVRPPSISDRHEGEEEVVSIETSLQKKNITVSDEQQKSDTPKRKKRKSGQLATAKKRPRRSASQAKSDEPASASTSSETNGLGEEIDHAVSKEVELAIKDTPRRRGRRSKPESKSLIPALGPDPLDTGSSPSSAPEDTGTSALANVADKNDQEIGDNPKPARKTKRRPRRKAALKTGEDDDRAKENKTEISKKVDQPLIEDLECQKPDGNGNTEPVGGETLQKKRGWWSNDPVGTLQTPGSQVRNRGVA